MKALFSLVLIFVATACGARPQHEVAQAPSSAELIVRDGWAAPSPAGVDVAAGYLTIANGTSAVDRVLSVTSPRAERVEIHEMAMEGAVMQMRPVPQLEIPAGQEIRLAPGGMHLMFYGVTEPFAEGQEIPVQLHFETTGAVDVSLPVRRAGETSHDAARGN